MEMVITQDFTYIDNVVRANVLSILTNDKKSLNEVYNTACSDRNSLIDLFGYLKKHLEKIDTKILNVEPFLVRIEKRYSFISID